MMKRSPEFYAGWTVAQLKAAEADYNQRCEDNRKEGNRKEALRWARMATVMALALESKYGL